MSWNTVSAPIQGFTVFQTAPGAVLSFVPAMGTAELDQLIDSYVVQAVTIQEKRAIVSMEFFTHNALTNQTHLFFPVSNPFSFTTTATDSPVSSLPDSGYGSAFNVSPVAQESLATPTSSAPNTPLTVLQPATSQRNSRVSKPKTKAVRKTTPAVGRVSPHDFSDMPGMKILTKDGLDVTNSARGGKSKEDREHAHLIRLLKSCPSCKRKKIRCDPSHKREALQHQAALESQPAAKSATIAVPSPPLSQTGTETPQAWAETKVVQSAGTFMEPLDFNFDLDVADIDEFLNLGANSTDVADYSFLMEGQTMLTPSSPFNISPAHQSFANFSPTQFVGIPSGVTIGEVQLPYLRSDAHGDNYVDFTLFSAASSPLGEEPQELRSSEPSPGHGDFQQSGVSRQRGEGVVRQTQSPLSPNIAQFVTVVTGTSSVDGDVDTDLSNSGLGDRDHGGPGSGGWGCEAIGGGIIRTAPHILDRIKPQYSGASAQGEPAHDVTPTGAVVPNKRSESLDEARPQRVVVAGTAISRTTQQPEPTTQPHDQQSSCSSSSSDFSADIRTASFSSTNSPVNNQSAVLVQRGLQTLGESVDGSLLATIKRISPCSTDTTAWENQVEIPTSSHTTWTYSAMQADTTTSTTYSTPQVETTPNRSISQPQVEIPMSSRIDWTYWAPQAETATNRTVSLLQGEMPMSSLNDWTYSALQAETTPNMTNSTPQVDVSVSSRAARSYYALQAQTTTNRKYSTPQVEPMTDRAVSLTQVETPVCVLATDATRDVCCENSVQNPRTTGESGHQPASSAATSGPGAVAVADTAAVSPAQESRPISCQPQHAPHATEQAASSCGYLYMLDKSWAGRQSLSVDAPSVTAAHGLLSSSMRVLGLVLLFAAFFQSLQESIFSFSILALSLTPILLRHAVPVSSSQSSSILSSIRKQVPANLLRSTTQRALV